MLKKNHEADSYEMNSAQICREQFSCRTMRRPLIFILRYVSGNLSAKSLSKLTVIERGMEKKTGEFRIPFFRTPLGK